MATSVTFCLSAYHMTNLNWILSPLKLTVVQQKMHGCHGHRHDITFSRQSVM